MERRGDDLCHEAQVGEELEFFEFGHGSAFDGLCRRVGEGLGGYVKASGDEDLSGLFATESFREGKDELAHRRQVIRRSGLGRLSVSRHDLVTLGDDGEGLSGDLTLIRRLSGGLVFEPGGATSGDGPASRAGKSEALKDDTVRFDEFDSGEGPDAGAAGASVPRHRLGRILDAGHSEVEAGLSITLVLVRRRLVVRELVQSGVPDGDSSYVRHRSEWLGVKPTVRKGRNRQKTDLILPAGPQEQTSSAARAPRLGTHMRICPILADYSSRSVTPA
jgi:hypothetical protein